MMLLKSRIEFLNSSDQNTLVAAFSRTNIAELDQAVEKNFFRSSLRYLKEKRPADFYMVLGCFFDIAAYPVDGEAGSIGAQPHEIGKYFISTNEGDFDDSPQLPLSNTVDEAMKKACDILQLEQLLEEEIDTGVPQRRVCFRKNIPSLSERMPEIFETVRQFDKLSSTELMLKVSEETGEFAQAILVERGKLPHKSLKETATGEAADVIISTIATLAKLYPEMSPSELEEELNKWIAIKSARYFGRILPEGSGEGTY